MSLISLGYDESGMSQEPSTDRSVRRRLLLLALGLAIFSVWLITVTFQLLLIDIAHTFHVQVGTASMVAAVGSISGVVAGLFMAVLSVRFNHKIFLLIGLLCTSLSALGFFFAPNFNFVLLLNVGVGPGIALATSIVYSLIGDFYSLEKRGKAIGWMVASTTLAYVVGAPVIGILASLGGWRSVMILFSLPIALASLTLVFFVIPKKSKQNIQSQREPFFAGCKNAFSNRSATAILLVTMFSMAEGSIGFYAISFFRSHFAISISFGALIIVAGNILAVAGGIVGGLLINRVGRKPLGMVAGLAAALLTLSFTFTPIFPISMGLGVLRFLFSAMAFTAGGALVMEQLPKFRSTMMSLNTTFMNLGMLMASLTGGIALNLYNYQTLALLLGGFGVTGTILWVTLVKDPCKTQK